MKLQFRMFDEMGKDLGLVTLEPTEKTMADYHDFVESEGEKLSEQLKNLGGEAQQLLKLAQDMESGQAAEPSSAAEATVQAAEPTAEAEATVQAAEPTAEADKTKRNAFMG